MIEIKNITILGAGNLGSRIGLQAAISGYRVVFYDLNEGAFHRAHEVFQKILKHLVKTEQLKHEATAVISSRIFFTTSPTEAVQDADGYFILRNSARIIGSANGRKTVSS